MISIMQLNSLEILNLVNIFSSRNSRFSFFAFDIGMVTQCTRFDKLAANSEPRKMDMYIQVGVRCRYQVMKEFVQEFGTKI